MFKNNITKLKFNDKNAIYAHVYFKDIKFLAMFSIIKSTIIFLDKF
jgi:hypothetical protein